MEDFPGVPGVGGKVSGVVEGDAWACVDTGLGGDSAEHVVGVGEGGEASRVDDGGDLAERVVAGGGDPIGR